MSTLSLTDNKSTDQTSIAVNQFVSSVIEALRHTEAPQEIVDDAEEKGMELSEAVESQSEELQSLREKAGDQEGEIDQLREELAHYREENELDKAQIRQKIEEEAGSPDANPGGNGEETTFHRPESPLERIVGLPEHMADSELTANQKRARFLAMDVEDYSRKVPAGRSIDSGTIRKVLKAKDGKTPHTETVSRVISFLDELGKDETKVVKRRGTRRVIFTENAVERLGRFSTRESSGGDSITGVVMGGT